MEKNDSVLSNVTSIENMARTLKDLGEEILKDSVTSKVLGSLSSKNDTLITAWESIEVIETGKQNIETLREQLLEEKRN